MRIGQILKEATRPYIEKVVDPALMTFSEYYNLVNPQDKFHPSDAYDVDLKKLNAYESVDDYQNLINTITINNIVFEIREKADDRWDKKYVKTDQDNNIVRDENGLATYLNDEEIKMIIPAEKRYDYEYAAIRKDTNEIVGKTENEWGTLLIMVAQEYRNFGFGTLLVKLKRQRNPEKSSGGFTRSGLKNFRRVHSQMVRDYMESGFYSYLVKNDVITSARVKAIVGSILSRPSKQKQKNLDTTNTSDWIIMTDEGSSYVIVYDKKLYQFTKDDIDYNDYWIEKFIIGMVGIGGSDKFTYIDRKYGPDNVISKSIEILINGEYPKPVYLEESEYNLIRNKNIKSEKINKNNNVMYKCWVNSPTVNIKQISNKEKKIRQKYDEYDELRYRIHEIAESLAK
jgi:hypothetical protein